MFTIKDENKKPLRRALDVLCGIDAIDEASIIPTISDGAQTIPYTFAPFPENARIEAIGLRASIMDLSGEGFALDGSCIPAQTEALPDSGKYGWLTPFYSDAEGYICNASGRCSITVYPNYDGLTSIVAMDAAIDAKNIIASEPVVYTRWKPNTRVIFDRIVPGIAFQFTNSELVECTLNLRGVETTVDNPTLQTSEIEIEAYAPNLPDDAIMQILEDSPIYYTSGYPGDMSPIRRFYLSGDIEYNESVIKLSGEDSTKFLEGEYPGKYIGGTSANASSMHDYFLAIQDIITGAGIDVEVTDTWADGYQSIPCMASFLDDRSKREHIAQAVNIYSFDSTFVGGTPYDAYINYVDAGIPKLWTYKRESIYDIDAVAEHSKKYEPRINRLEMSMFGLWVGASQEVETVQANGARIRNVSDPYYSFTTSKGTVSKITPYTYKIKNSGTAVVSGRPIVFEDWNDTSVPNNPVVAEREGRGVTVTLDELHGFPIISDSAGQTYLAGIGMLGTIIERSRVLHTFTWRGDPKLQPRDYIRVDGIEMTIDTVTLEHSEGGLKSTITAREGLF